MFREANKAGNQLVFSKYGTEFYTVIKNVSHLMQ